MKRNVQPEISDKVLNLAVLYSRARSVKEAARLRAQCDLEEWEMVKKEAFAINLTRNRDILQ